MLGLAGIFAAKQAKIMTSPRHAAFGLVAFPRRLPSPLPFRRAMS